MTVAELLDVMEERFVIICDKFGNYVDTAYNSEEARKKWRWRDYEVTKIGITSFHDIKINIDWGMK